MLPGELSFTSIGIPVRQRPHSIWEPSAAGLSRVEQEVGEEVLVQTPVPIIDISTVLSPGNSHDFFLS